MKKVRITERELRFIILDPNPTRRAVKKMACGIKLTPIEKGLIAKQRRLK